MFFLLEELAFYGIYTLIDYSVHEIAAIIPVLAIPATAIFLVIEIIAVVKKKCDKSSKWLVLLFVCLIVLQSSWFVVRADDISTSGSATLWTCGCLTLTVTLTLMRQRPTRLRTFAGCAEMRYVRCMMRVSLCTRLGIFLRNSMSDAL